MPWHAPADTNVPDEISITAMRINADHCCHDVTWNRSAMQCVATRLVATRLDIAVDMGHNHALAHLAQRIEQSAMPFDL